jgi:hypothetical protein
MEEFVNIKVVGPIYEREEREEAASIPVRIAPTIFSHEICLRTSSGVSS